MKREVKVFSNVGFLNFSALKLFKNVARESIRERGFFSVAFSGGKTPISFYKLIGQKLKKGFNWKKVHIFQADERTVPVNHPENNFALLKKGFLDRVSIPPENIHRIHAEEEDLNRVAEEYEFEIQSFFRGKSPKFDLLFLGVGTDGHTASLFENSRALKEKKRLVAKNYYKKLGFWRITFTLSLINNARNIVFIVDGKEKSKVVKNILASKNKKFPAALVKPKDGNLFWLLTKSTAIGLN